MNDGKCETCRTSPCGCEPVRETVCRKCRGTGVVRFLWFWKRRCKEHPRPMRCVDSSEMGYKLLKAWGVKGKIRKFTVTFAVGEPVTVIYEQVLDDAEIKILFHYLHGTGIGYGGGIVQAKAPSPVGRVGEP